MKYVAKGTHNRHFELLDANELSLGKLDYTSWFTIKAELVFPGDKHYNIAPTNLWHTSIAVTSDGADIANVSINWKGQIIVSMEGGQTYTFKRKGFFNWHYGLFNEQDQELVMLHQKFNWGTLSFNYDIEADDNYADGKNPVLILLLIYCANYIQHMHAAVV